MKKNEKANQLLQHLQIHSFRRREQLRREYLKNQILLIPFGNSRGIEYMCLHLCKGKYLEQVKEIEKSFIINFVDRYCRVENIEKYIGESEEMEEKLCKFVNNVRLMNVAEVKLDLLEFYMNARLDLLWRSLKKFNHQKKRRSMIIIISQIKQLLKQSSFLMKMVENKLETNFGTEKYQCFRYITNLTEHLNSGFVNQGLNELYHGLDSKFVEYKLPFKLSFIQYERYREEMDKFFKNILWSHQISLQSFQQFIFERELDSPLKAFLLLHSVEFQNEGSINFNSCIYDPLVREIEEKSVKQEEIRKIIANESIEFFQQEPLQDYFRKLYENLDTEKNNQKLKQPFSNLFSSNESEEEKKILSPDFIKTSIEECLTQYQLLELLDKIYPYTDQNYHFYYKPTIEAHLREELLIEPLLRKNIFKEEIDFITKCCSDLREMCQNICTQFGNSLSTL